MSNGSGNGAQAWNFFRKAVSPMGYRHARTSVA
jgi:hypothetical protein